MHAPSISKSAQVSNNEQDQVSQAYFVVLHQKMAEKQPAIIDNITHPNQFFELKYNQLYGTADEIGTQDSELTTGR